MRRCLVLLSFLVLAQTAVAQEVVLRHALSGRALDALSTLVLRFNDEQKGKGRVTLEELAGVADRQRLPQMALLDADDARQFFDTRPRFKPLTEVMKEGGQR